VRIVITFVAWVGSVVLLAPVCFFVVIVLAGPHSSLLPGWLQPAVLVLGWLVLLLVPLLIARKVWSRIES
jgi:hypothetical protein